MADLAVTQLTELAATPAVNDQLLIVDVSDTSMSASGTTKRIAANRFVNTAGDKTFITGDGTTGVLPQAGTVPVVDRANTFWATQTFRPPSGIGVNIFPAAGATPFAFVGSDIDNGALTGPIIAVGRNNNASTPAAGSLRLLTRAADTRYFWVDASALLRIHSSQPTNATDTAGSVVGDQTSHIDYKDIVGAPIDDEDALANIIAAAATVQRFTYKSGAYNNQEFSGIILDGETLQRYGKDADAAHPAGRALNEINIIGDLLLAIRQLEARIAVLEGAS